LREGGFDVTQPTAWSAEGLLPYLPPRLRTACSQHHRAQRAGQRLATEHVPDPNAFSDERMQRISERWRRFGFHFNAADLFYQGAERSVVTDYLTTHGSQVTRTPFSRNS
jgi:O-methyltransferase involved in polyketide biosynthesis